jgi:Ca-activated chloride channel family protein
VVTPLTDDNSTIANLIPALETEMMPAQGSDLSAGLAKANSLFTQAGIVKGDILVVTDDIKPRYETTIEKLTSQGHRLSIFGIGTADGAPIPLTESQTGGFLLDKNGAIVIPKLESSRLQKYALRGNGLYTELSADDSDTEKLSKLFRADRIDQSEQTSETDDDSSDLFADTWREEAHWLLLPLLFFAALWARRGWISALLPFFITTTLATGSLLPQDAHADTDKNMQPSSKTIGIDLDHLRSSPDQKAMKAFDAGDNKKAAETFQRKDWKASAQYRAGDYEAALKSLKNAETSSDLYNKGNALAKLGRYQEAISAYDAALELDDGNDDARRNREQVKKALQDQQQENSEQNKSEQDNSDQESNDQDKQQQDQDQKDQSQQDQRSESEDSNQDDQQPSDNNTNPEEQKQSEEKELKQRDAEKEKQQQQKEQQEYEKNKDKQDQQNPDSVEHKEDEQDELQDDPKEIEINPVEASISEQEKATEQWLKRIPDDPSGLLRRKFLYQYNQNTERTDSDEPW